MNSGKIEYYTLVRGIAIMAIIFTHIHQVFDIPESLRIVPRFGQMGCQIFLVISGFFAYKPLTTYKETNGNWNRETIVAYYKKRLKRIVPGYWMTICLGIIVTTCSVCIFGENYTSISTKITDIVINVLLLNGITPTSANNHIVRGGWFVGTLVILYLLKPLLIRFYDTCRQKKLIPLITVAICATILISVGKYFQMWECNNNSIQYFSFVNQLQCYILGFRLKDLYNNKQLSSISYPLIKGMLLAIIGISLFYIGIIKSCWIMFTIVPFICSSAFYFFSCYYLTKERKTQHKIGNVVAKFGNLDYSIMLIHPFIVFDLCKVLLHYTELPHIELFIILTPIWYITIYYISLLYNNIINRFTGLIFK